MKSWFSCRASGKTASISIFDEIGGFGVSMSDFTEAVKNLGTFDHLRIEINSGGGDVFTGIGLYNFLRALKARKTVSVLGLAASIASVIALAGDEIEIPDSAFFMIHDPSAMVIGGAGEMDKMADTLRNVKNTLVDIYAVHTGLSTSVIEEMMAAETWLNGKEAVTKGFATKLIAAPAMAASINLSSFNRVPEEVRRTFFRTENYMKDETKPGADNTLHRGALVDELAGPKPKADNTPKVDNKAEIEREASRIAEDRVKHITAAYRAGRDLGLENECQRLMDDGIPAAEIPDLLIQVFAKRNQRNAAVGSLIPSGITMGFSNEDPKVVLDRMAEGIVAQYVPGAKVSDASKEYQGWRPQAFMRAALELRGTDTRRMQPAEIVNAAMTTSDFPLLLGTSANKIFLGAYEVAEGSYRAVAARRDLPNFQAQDLLRPGDFPALAPIAEGGEVTAGGMSERKETAQLKTFGRMIQLSRQALVNDSLGAFGTLAQQAGVAAAVLENATVWSLITANAALSDSVALFHATHGNLGTGGGSALSATSLGSARAAMRVQKSLDGLVLNISPSVLVVPAALETAAEQLLNGTYVPSAAGTAVTPTMRSLTVVPEPLLDAASATAWYLFASPALRGGAVVYGSLEGNTGPRVTVDAPFAVDGIQLKVI